MSTVSEALAGQEFHCEVEDRYMVADALVVMRHIDKETGESSVFISATKQTDFVTRLGLVECLRQINEGGWEEDDDEL